MTTMAQAIRSFVEAAGRPVTAEQVRRHIETNYPGQWQPRTLQAHMYACAINNPKAYVHHPSTERFLYKKADGSFELYSEQLHGPNEWAPTEGEDEAQGLEEMIETSISLERDIEDHLVHHLDGIEKGLTLVGRQVIIDVGRIDILAQDAKGQRVVIEVKVGAAKDSAVGQIARYLGWYARADGQPARGILIAAEFPEGVCYAATAIPNLQLIAYRVQFAFEPATI
jgi:RecB family endonuclease NucS